MAEQPRVGSRSSRLDRVSRPQPRSPRERDREGKEALYSTAPGAAPTSVLLVACDRCDVERGLGVRGSVRLLTPPFLWNPVTGRVLTRCPTCDRWSWLRVRTGQALRALLGRVPS